VSGPPVTAGQSEYARGFLRGALPIAAIVLLGIVAYKDALHGAFVFDDVQQIRENPVLRDLGNFFTRWDSYRAMPNRYVAYVTFALNYRLGQVDPAGYHAVNLGIHLLNALLVYALVVLSFRTPRLERSALAATSAPIAFVASALFVTHPIQTQAVTYVVQRLSSLATCFYLATLVLYVAWRLGREPGRWGRGRRVAAYSAAVLCAVAAMKTKEIAFTLPFVVALYELSFFSGSARERLRFLAPILATAVIIPLTLLNLHQPIGRVLSDVSDATRVQATVSRLDYLRTQVAVVASYLRLLVLPTGQNIDHDVPVARSLLEPRVAASLAVLLSIAALAAFLHRRARAGDPRRALDPAVRLVSFGIAWFFATLLVESSVIPIIDVMYEHRVYLPFIGFFVAVAIASAAAWRRLAPASSTRLTVLSGTLVALVLAAATVLRNDVWADDVSLWTDAAAKSPGKPRPHINLGTALAAAGDLGGAERELRRAVSLDPASAWARAQLAAVLLSEGRPAEAEPELREAIRLSPADPEAIFNLAMMLSRTGRAAEANTWFARFLDVAPPSYAAARRIARARVGH